MPTRLTKEQFIERARAIHGDKYDYSKVVYVNCDTKVEIGCNACGWFFQTPYKHYMGQGCRACGIEKRRATQSCSQEQVIQDFIEIHGEKYDYSKVLYLTNKDKVRVKCKSCERWFMITPNHHKRGTGCRQCGYARSSASNTRTHKQVIDSFRVVHGKKYNYSRVQYTKGSVKVEIGCTNCGDWFWQAPIYHKSGQGCPKCSMGASERLFGECLKELGYKASKVRPKWLRNPKTGHPLELDYYIATHKVAFEVQGLQHYEPIDYWGGEDNFQKQQARDQQKRNLCFMMGVILYEYDLRLGKDKESMKAFLKEVLPKPKKRKRKRSQ